MFNTLRSFSLIKSSFDKIWNIYKEKATFVQLLPKFNMGSICVDTMFALSTLNEENIQYYGV